MVSKHQDCPRKLVLVISSMRGGGAERVMAELAGYWAERSTHVTLLTLDDPALPDAYRVHPSVRRVSAFHPPGRNGLERLWRTVQRVVAIRRTLKRIGPQVVLSFMTATNVLTILAARGLPVRVVVSERTDPEADRSLGRFWTLARRYLYGRADQVVAQSPRACAWLTDRTGGRVRCIPNPIRDLPPIEVERERLIVAVGRLSAEKGFDTLLKAFAQVIGRHPDWKLLLVGEGEQKVSLLELTCGLGLDGLVEFTGWIKHVQELQARAAIVVQPSRFEGFPNAVLEAMAMGAPVIASSAAGEAIIEHRKNGLLVPVGDVQGFARALLELIEDPSQRRRLGEAAKSVRREFCMDSIMPLWESALFADGRSSSAPPER